MSEVRKQCSKCGETKPLTEFYKNKRARYGVASSCKVCRKAYAAENKERIKAYKAKYQAENAERIKARKAKYYAENREKVKAQQAKYYAENKEEIKAKNAMYRAENRDKYRAISQRYRAKKRDAPGTFTEADWKEKLAYYGYRCRYCGIDKRETKEGWLEADHAIPLSRGGANFISNIVPACKSCNCSKGTKTLKEFMNIQQKNPDLT